MCVRVRVATLFWRHTRARVPQTHRLDRIGGQGKTCLCCTVAPAARSASRPRLARSRRTVDEAGGFQQQTRARFRYSQSLFEGNVLI